ncbi:MAG: type II toxin-antitoxin system PemK/MazF family toxin [Alkalispirochaeta sp.]
MKRQWEVYATDATRDITFLVISSDEVNELFSYVTVVPVVTRAEGREVYPIEAVLPVSFASSTAGRHVGNAEAVPEGHSERDRGGQDGSSVALVHQIRTLKANRLTDRRGAVDDEDARTAVRAAMTAYFGL